MKTVGVFGASGFVGTALYDRLAATGQYDLKPFTHTTGNAWLLARRGIRLDSVDLLDPAAVRKAVEGCTHVVNCTRGPRAVMFRGLRNLLTASRRAGVARFVHLSSSAIYGELPADGGDEEAEARPERGTYAWMKATQDTMVQAACWNGLPSVILCPVYITGPYSLFLLGVLQAMRRGQVSLVEDGANPCSVVNVNNLAKAIELALTRSKADAGRMFVTDDETLTWSDFFHRLEPLAGRELPRTRLSAKEARALRGSGVPPGLRASLRRTAGILLSPDVRRQLRSEPLVAQAYGFVQSSLRWLPRGARRRVEAGLQGSPRVWRPPGVPANIAHLHGIQLHQAHHSCARAKAELGYRPDHRFAEGMEAFEAWYHAIFGWDSAFWPLFAQL